MLGLANLLRSSDRIFIALGILLLAMPAAIAQAFTSDGKFIEPTIIGEASPQRTGRTARSNNEISAEAVRRARIEKEQALIYSADHMDLQKNRTPPQVLLHYAQFAMEIGRSDLAQKFFVAILAVLDDSTDSKFKEIALGEYKKFVEATKNSSRLQSKPNSPPLDSSQDTGAVQTSPARDTAENAASPNK